MIPADVASSLRQILPDTQAQLANPQTQPVVAAQKLADVLSDLAPGQRLMAEVQAALPNGTYRALMAQRQITLALPFSAKPGDSLELEVRESDGQLSLAVVTERPSETRTSNTPESVPTSLSQTGKLIGDLISGNASQKAAPPVTLNASQALVNEMPETAAQLAPILKQAITQSGMFYEAHQAKWVAGQLPTSALRLEPQGKIPVLPVRGGLPKGFSPVTGSPPTSTGGGAVNLPQESALATSSLSPFANSPNTEPQTSPGSSASPAALQTTDIASLPARTPSQEIEEQSSQHSLPPKPGQEHLSTEQPNIHRPADSPSAAGSHAERIGNPQLSSALPGSPPENLVSIVRQQLEGLANNNFVWHGQIWPGQQMEWEIGEPPEHRTASITPEEKTWQSRLKLTLPVLGEIEASLRLQPGGKLALEITSGSEASEARLRQRADQLVSQFTNADLELIQLQFRHERPEA